MAELDATTTVNTGVPLDTTPPPAPATEAPKAIKKAVWTIEIRENDSFLLTNQTTKESVVCQLNELETILRK